MEYLDSIAEVILVITLVLFIHSLLSNQYLRSPIRHFITLALITITVTAFVGAVRFAGVDDVIELHDGLSFVSTKLAMVVYATCLPIVIMHTSAQSVRLTERRGQLDSLRIVRCAIGLLVVGIVLFGLQATQLVVAPSLITDGLIFIGLILFNLQTRNKHLAFVALIILLLVPVTSLLPINENIHVALFHLLLAAHFKAIQVALTRHKNKTNTAHSQEIGLQSS